METCDSTNHARPQFGLAALFEHLTVCSLPLAWLRLIGLSSSLLLTTMALALGFRRGGVALVLLIGASLAADASSAVASASFSRALDRQMVIGLLGAALCGWYKLRRREGAGGRANSALTN